MVTLARGIEVGWKRGKLAVSVIPGRDAGTLEWASGMTDYKDG